MQIKPVYATVGDLFRSRPMFYIPKYQRAYAWESEPIADFIKDVKNCVGKRAAGNPVKHFLGGILSVEHDVPGVINQHEYEIIDGQQRIATITLLAAALVETYKALADEAEQTDLVSEAAILRQRIKDLTERFVEFDQEVHNVIQTADVLRMSKADDPFYRPLIRKSADGAGERDSHKRLQYAYSSLDKTIQELVKGHATIKGKIDELKTLETVLVGDLTVIHMVVGERKDAYTLFQVINDRGTNLTDGDLLRAKTLELLEGHSQEQSAVEILWDKILADPPALTNNFLNWIYESFVGARTPQNALFDMFLAQFFPQYSQNTLQRTEAKQVLKTLQVIYSDIIKCRKLVSGQWLYEPKRPVTGWDRTRLNLLLVELDHVLSIPFLLAASNLDHRMFSDLVQMIERTFFRYKLICNQHPASLKAIYLKEAVAIRANPANYKTSQLKTQLRDLINSKAGNASFRSGLSAMEYQTGGGNQRLKYFLMTIEYYYRWFIDGAAGAPTCVDKTRVYDFTSTTIEHVYPQNAAAGTAVHNVKLEPIKQTLGNLTIMDPKQNATGGNAAFSVKKPLYLASSVLLTQEIGQKSAWTPAEISTHQDALINAAMKVFLP
jgi:hypothetical protein